ncbi:hypothetical protein [Natronosalvus amylolyticus]|uniref:hypothetical protein n=1 Tax=Natronosalvus amylolyticus TaxID=2961994 RepID=UPI0020C9E335|nr:hypothetical protein [Natronosalvus amylolyticus]
MQDFSPDEGDYVRIDIPDERDPDHKLHHGNHGYVKKVLSDDAGGITGEQMDGVIYRVEFKDGTCADFRHHDLRPPIE